MWITLRAVPNIGLSVFSQIPNSSLQYFGRIRIVVDGKKETNTSTLSFTFVIFTHYEIFPEYTTTTFHHSRSLYVSCKIRAVAQYYRVTLRHTNWPAVSWLQYTQVMALLPSASCLHGSHAVDVAPRHGRGISWYPSHSMRSTLQWGYCSLACDANYVTWSDWRPDNVAWFRTLMPVNWAFDGAFKALCTSWFAFTAALTKRC